ncbi:adenylate/guanylate cyclase domain-containing protein [Flagellimonas sp. DF-77]|uniref:adenylate/guanylate cyclase domain-containing protein n=1 Tax=Flagellimonas algarum TaxID=3230298 RepID=UPI0033941A20
MPFGLVPMVFSLVYSLLEKGILGTHPTYPSTGNPYQFILIVPALISLFLGFLIGLLEVFVISRLFVKSSFLKKLILKTMIYFLIIVVSIVLISLLSTAHEYRLPPFSSEVLESVETFFRSFAFWSVVVYFTLGLVICLFYAEISDNLGQYAIANFFTGKYHRPIEEYRIFMFLDMKSSTTIAERLGHEKYFDLLNDYYRYLSNPIMDFGGEIYQYVGDEIVLTWRLNTKMDKASVVYCFFSMQETLAEKSTSFLKRYGLVPSFKAAIHLGKVTTGEIGKIKKDFVFSGDVLNTTARIQGLCNEHNARLLCSEEAVTQLELRKSFEVIDLGTASLRGKEDKIKIFDVIAKKNHNSNG